MDRRQIRSLGTRKPKNFEKIDSAPDTAWKVATRTSRSGQANNDIFVTAAVQLTLRAPDANGGSIAK